ncbi:MAG TPA: YceI family protein [Verrucomicrobia bacterium]|nr:YceI family protein [Verrucomicrobiota bacterium]HOP97268.1 YceI family protein [Verrucomicrobiota bacterium]HPU55658.1 YceI family protein [Verrucomicrobiota bacterium]
MKTPILRIKKHLPWLVPVVVAGALTGCSDPADGVHKSAAGEAQTASTRTAGKPYTIQPDSKINFVGSKVTGKHDGGFTNFSGTISVADGKVVDAEIKINLESTWSDNQRLTAHLKSPDFFDVANFPTSTFTVTSIEGSGAQQKVTGNLELHGVTKSISFPADIQVSDDTVTVKAEFAINRKDFGIMYSGRADDLIRDDVVIKLDVKATPQT